ncbi:MAG: hypothetical protein ACD_8C00016G0001 [uncultured bacterium]|nr:MAG: hypothetical protein ACD_8C00016G0001 [uncultured bacterium]
MKNDKKIESIVLGGGCFWCLEAVFLHVKGVQEVISGYAGGQIADPTYEKVASGKTGHAEVVQVKFDSAEISLEDILHIFFTVHDPTTINRQGNDVGTQYRSIVLCSLKDQCLIVEKVLQEVASEKVWENSIVTEVAQLKNFYPAEEYHQKYFEKNPEQAYCQIIIAPKVGKLREKYSKFYR